MTTIYKYPQHILAIDKSFIESRNIQEGLTSIDIFDFAEKVSPHLVIRQRNILDGDGRTHFGDKNYLQVIPYFTVEANILDIDTKEPMVKQTMVYQRTKGSGESRLMGNYSIGFGGHVDIADVVYNEDSVIDFIATLKLCAEREAQEELLNPSEFDRETTLTGKVLLDYSNDVGKLHIGFILEMTYTPVVTQGDAGQSVKMLLASETEAHSVGYFSDVELVELLNKTETEKGSKFEKWSKILIENT